MSMAIETKPFSIQSPEAIAKEYGGNKQKIAQAMQMGIIDPTAGTLAGMFIDRMRSAAQQEQAPQQTIAQQVMAPQPQVAPPAGPPAGLGATPEAAQMMAPPAMEEPQAMVPQPMEQAMGMAAGGLADLPVPESMFDEPNNGGYAGGGIVAFADAGSVKAKRGLTPTPDYSVLQQMIADLGDDAKGRAEYEAMYQPKREYAERANQYNKDLLSEEGQKKRRSEDIGSFLMRFGTKLASTPGDLLTAAGVAGGEALPGLEESRKERRAEMRDALKQLAADEGMTNAEQREFVKHMMGRKDKRADISKDLAQMMSADARTRAELESRQAISAAEINAQKFIASIKQPNESWDELAFRVMTMDPRKPGAAAAQAAVEKIYGLKKTAADSFAPGFEGTGGDGAGQPKSNRIRFDALK